MKQQINAKNCPQNPRERRDTDLLPEPAEGTSPSHTLILDYWLLEL